MRDCCLCWLREKQEKLSRCFGADGDGMRSKVCMCLDLSACGRNLQAWQAAQAGQLEVEANGANGRCRAEQGSSWGRDCGLEEALSIHVPLQGFGSCAAPRRPKFARFVDHQRLFSFLHMTTSGTADFLCVCYDKQPILSQRRSFLLFSGKVHLVLEYRSQASCHQIWIFCH